MDEQWRLDSRMLPGRSRATVIICSAIDRTFDVGGGKAGKAPQAIWGRDCPPLTTVRPSVCPDIDSFDTTALEALASRFSNEFFTSHECLHDISKSPELWVK